MTDFVKHDCNESFAHLNGRPEAIKDVKVAAKLTHKVNSNERAQVFDSFLNRGLFISDVVYQERDVKACEYARTLAYHPE